jgi:hypothetical protein
VRSGTRAGRGPGRTATSGAGLSAASPRREYVTPHNVGYLYLGLSAHFNKKSMIDNINRFGSTKNIHDVDPKAEKGGPSSRRDARLTVHTTTHNTQIAVWRCVGCVQ